MELLWRYRNELVYVATALAGVAAFTHLVIVPEHFAEWWGFGAFFLLLAVAQASYAAALVKWPRPSVFLLGIVGHVALLGIYIVTRTAGIPLGPLAGHVEGVGTLDIVSKAVEIALMAALAGALAGGVRQERLEPEVQRRAP